MAGMRVNASVRGSGCRTPSCVPFPRCLSVVAKPTEGSVPLAKSVPRCVNPSQLRSTNQLAINLVNLVLGRWGSLCQTVSQQ